MRCRVEDSLMGSIGLLLARRRPYGYCRMGPRQGLLRTCQNSSEEGNGEEALSEECGATRISLARMYLQIWTIGSTLLPILSLALVSYHVGTEPWIGTAEGAHADTVRFGTAVRQASSGPMNGGRHRRDRCSRSGSRDLDGHRPYLSHMHQSGWRGDRSNRERSSSLAPRPGRPPSCDGLKSREAHFHYPGILRECALTFRILTGLEDTMWKNTTVSRDESGVARFNGEYRRTEDRKEVGKKARSEVPRESHAGWDPSAASRDSMENPPGIERRKTSATHPHPLWPDAEEPAGLLPRLRRADGPRPLVGPESPGSRSRPAGTAISPTSASSPPPSGTSSSTSTTSTRPTRPRSSGT